MKANPLSICAPELVLVPLIGALPWDGLALTGPDIEQPHAVRLPAIFMAEQDEVPIVRIDQNMIDPELLAAKDLLGVPRGRIHTDNGASRLLKKLVVWKLLASIGPA